MTNLERIKTMSATEFIMFLKYCDFTGIFPVIAGMRFSSDKDVVDWLEQNENEPISAYFKPKRPLGIYHVYLTNAHVKHILADMCLHQNDKYCFYKNGEIKETIDKKDVDYMETEMMRINTYDFATEDDLDDI